METSLDELVVKTNLCLMALLHFLQIPEIPDQEVFEEEQSKRLAASRC